MDRSANAEDTKDQEAVMSISEDVTEADAPPSDHRAEAEEGDRA
jgi:hypothetical protein